jgi:cardiolipin synthase A/B
MKAIPRFPPITAKVDGHKLSLFVSGADRLAALLDIIESAKTSLRLFFYMFSDDETAHRVRDAMIAAAKRGVKVSLLIDDFGSNQSPADAYQPMIDAGISFARFVPRLSRRYLMRNHQKIVVADEARALVGGSNVDARYFDDDPEGKSWHDLYLVVEGPAAKRLALYYDGLARWTKAGSGSFRGLLRLLSRRSERRGKLRWLFNGPFRRISPLTRSISTDFDRAEQLDMVHAYFAPNWGLLRKIGRVVKRGGRARIITAARSDNQTTIAAARHCYRRLLRNGVEIAEYLPQMLHMKLIVVDDAVYIGSANFDMRSLYINGEIMLRIEDQAFAAAARGLIESHRPHCDEISRAEHRARSTWLSRAHWLISYFIVSSLDFRMTRGLGLTKD